MKYVLDASVAYKWAVPEINSDKANRLREDVRNLVHEILAPDFYPAELAHALTRAERKKIIAVGQADILWVDAMTSIPYLIHALPFIRRAVAISSQTRQGVYDCMYVALAEHESIELITADDKLVKNLQPQFPFIRHLSTLP